MSASKRLLELSPPNVRELVDMHRYKRPHGHAITEHFCKTYLDSIPGMKKDAVGNRMITIMQGESSPNILWSSHTDTVHEEGGYQKLAYGDGYLYVSEDAKSNCLGADCTVGVWIMRQMILREVPGLYIFHAGEEVGGVGSSYIAETTPEILRGIDIAIALDRRGYTSVITHQGARCCSDTFANALCEYLGDFEADDGGTFTDTANYTYLVPECTNISVGYLGAHTSNESLDIDFAVWLMHKLCGLNANELPVLRDPSVTRYDGSWKKYYSSATDNRSIYSGKYGRSPPSASRETEFDRIENLVYQNSEAITQLLIDMGADEELVNLYIKEQEAKVLKCY